MRQAVAEHDAIGREAFLAKYGFEAARHFAVVVDGLRYDPKAIVGAAHQYGNGRPLRTDEFSGGEAHANRVLRDLGFAVQDLRQLTADQEREWRLAVYARFRRAVGPGAKPSVLRELGVYGGAQGIWVDLNRTRALAPEGVAVGLLHTGTSYADDLSSGGVIYHYPTTGRPAARDAGEVQATKNAARLHLPVFVVIKAGLFRQVRLAWVEGWDDRSRVFLVTFSESEPAVLLEHDDSDDVPFQLEVKRQGRQQLTHARHGQARFRLRTLQRYGPVCALTDINVPEMLDAVHLRGDAHSGSSDPRNGLILNAALHRAFDRHLFAIHPDTLQVETRVGGPNKQDLGITHDDISHLLKKPHVEALRWRHEDWLSRGAGRA